MSKETGGPAFPQCSYNMTGGYDITGGISIRDYFAAKVLAGAYPNHYQMFVEEIFDDWHGDGIELLAREAYLIADAMLEARKQ